MKFAILTISSSRYENKDLRDDFGEIARDMLQNESHEIIYYNVLPDKEDEIRNEVVRLMDGDADVIITSGGTGISPKDVTIEALSDLIKKDMPGFGEIFRARSYEQMGSAAVLTRALAGISDGKAIFCLPGSPNAVKLGLSLIMPEIDHVLSHARGKNHH